MPELYARIQRLIREHPWAILPSAFDLVLEIVDRRVAGERLSAEEISASIEAARRARTAAPAPGNVAVIPVFGVLAHRMHLFENVSQSGTSTEAVGIALRSALDDPSVGSIVLDVDSPGGSVFGVQELADLVAAAAQRKPVTAVANSMAASAAYWTASQAGELVVTPGGQVGSIGVLAPHDDVSKAAETQGRKRTHVPAGRDKAEGTAFEPLGDEARAYLQSQVDAYYAAFVKAVARGRRTSQTAVREGFGEGRMVNAEAAVAAGMADRVATLDEVVGELTLRQAKGAAAARAETTDRDRLRLQLAVAEAAQRRGA